MTRLDELYVMQRELDATRVQVDAEIVAELAALRRMADLRDQAHEAMQTSRVSVVRILLSAAEAFGVDLDTMKSGNRIRHVLDARHIASWLLHDAGVTYTEIGQTFGQDHTTVMNAVGRVNRTPRLLALAAAIRAESGPRPLAAVRRVG